MKKRQFLQNSMAVALLASLVGCSGDSDTPRKQTYTITGQLNDTGLLLCSAATQGQLQCPQGELPRQDGEFGRDAQAQAGKLSKTGMGLGGFDWIKLDSTGKPLTHQNSAWSAEGTEEEGSRWSCVQDQVTKLMWEVKESDPEHPRYGGHSYRWWLDDATLNGSFPDQSTSGTCPLASCDTQSYIHSVNQISLCGHSDWRLPSVSELSSIVVASAVMPAVDKNFFPNTLQPRFFTNQSLARDPSRAWYVYFSDGSVSFTNKGDASQVRLVRGGQ